VSTVNQLILAEFWQAEFASAIKWAVLPFPFSRAKDEAGGVQACDATGLPHAVLQVPRREFHSVLCSKGKRIDEKLLLHAASWTCC